MILSFSLANTIEKYSYLSSKTHGMYLCLLISCSLDSIASLVTIALSHRVGWCHINMFYTRVKEAPTQCPGGFWA